MDDDELAYARHVNGNISIIVQLTSSYPSIQMVSSYSSCIQRSCQQFSGLQIAAVQARSMPTVKHSIYAIYVEDVKTGRSWIVLRRYSELFRLRKALRAHLETYMETTEKVILYEEARLLNTQMEHIEFPAKFSFSFKDSKQVMSSRAQGFASFLQGLVDLVHDGVLNQRILSQSSKNSPVSFIKSSLLSFLGGKFDKAAPTFDFQEPIPQSFLTPEKRVVISRCGDLETVVEDDYRVESVQTRAPELVY